MIKSRVYLAGLALAVAAAAAHAELSVTPAVVSDYDWRGNSQSGKDPAFQLGADYSTGPFHVGVWGSTVDFGDDTDVELDLLADFSFGSDETANFNTGFVYYTYPGSSDYNFPEIWFKASKSFFTAALNYSWDFANLDESGWYADVSAAFPLGETGIDLTAHIGHAFGDVYDTPVGNFDYTDYSIGIAKSFGNFDTALKFVASDQDTNEDDVFNNEDRVIFSVSTTLPWAKE
jgi:uncharacterized protein (TIGR02001 family)